MKNLMLIIVLLCLSLMVCACSNSNNIASDTTNQNNLITNHEQKGDIVTPHGGERPLLTFESVGEYTDFINSKKLPENFVTYEKINQLGDFKNLIFLSATGENDFSSYVYTLVDSTGYEIALYIDNLVMDEIVVPTDTIANINANDMRTIPEKNNGTFTTKGISYKYVAGELLSISWIDQGISFKVCGSSTLSDYPTTQSTFVGKMLNTNVAVHAIEDFFSVADK